jgi:hypothetical protein
MTIFALNKIVGCSPSPLGRRAIQGKKENISTSTGTWQFSFYLPQPGYLKKDKAAIIASGVCFLVKAFSTFIRKLLRR